ncbi:MAG: 50S ribosomal protein L7/L12 [Planctomycetota bacterium]|jgi:large subunit ribosomal protein L7/L12
MAEEAATKTYPEKVQKILDLLKDFTLMELKELKEAYEETFGVQAAGMAMGVVAAPGAAAATESAEQEEASVFNVVLKDIGAKKIQVIKAVREMTGLGLKEAKDLVDSTVQGPSTVKENLTKDEAEQAQKKLEESGATVALQPA